MSKEGETPQSILEEIMEEMFQKLEKENEFNTETINKLRDLANVDILIKGDNLLELLQGNALRILGLKLKTYE